MSGGCYLALYSTELSRRASNQWHTVAATVTISPLYLRRKLAKPSENQDCGGFSSQFGQIHTGMPNGVIHHQNPAKSGLDVVVAFLVKFGSETPDTCGIGKSFPIITESYTLHRSFAPIFLYIIKFWKFAINPQIWWNFSSRYAASWILSPPGKTKLNSGFWCSIGFSSFNWYCVQFIEIHHRI